MILINREFCSYKLFCKYLLWLFFHLTLHWILSPVWILSHLAEPAVNFHMNDIHLNFIAVFPCCVYFIYISLYISNIRKCWEQVKTVIIDKNCCLFAFLKYIFLYSTIYSCLILLHSLNSLDSPMNQSSSKQFLIKNCSSIWTKIRPYNSRRNKEKNKNILNDRYRFCLKTLLRNCDQLELIYRYMNNYQRACCLLTPLVFCHILCGTFNYISQI